MTRHHMTPDGQVPFTAEEEAAWDARENQFKIEKQSTGYISERRDAYPSIADQLDTIFHDGLDAWKAQIQAVKDKYPKG